MNLPHLWLSAMSTAENRLTLLFPNSLGNLTFTLDVPPDDYAKMKAAFELHSKLNPPLVEYKMLSSVNLDNFELDL